MQVTDRLRRGGWRVRIVPHEFAMPPVYLDHNATTPLDPRVRAAMLPWMADTFGNPSSVHRYGQAAREAVEEARDAVAALLGALPAEIVFTASGTEGNNAVLYDVARRARRLPGDPADRAAAGGGHLVISILEHASLREAATRLDDSFEITWVKPREDGRVAAEDMAAALRPDTKLAVLMLAQNEIGTLQPVAEVARLCRERGVPVLCDAAQAVGKVEVDVEALGVDFLTLGAHKFYGPLGAGALWIRRGVLFEGFLLGGGQERRRRSSTENVPAIVGLGKACEIARQELETRVRHLRRVRDRFEERLAGRPGIVLHCVGTPRLPHTSHFAVLGIDAQDLLIRLDLAGYAVSTGSACSSGAVEPSKVLTAMGMPADEARASLRVSFGVANTVEQADQFAGVLLEEAEALRRSVASPLVFQ
jgi:cysteine desulfurase